MSYPRNLRLFMLLLCCSNSFATDMLRSISVTASRSTTPTENVAGALTVITKQEIKNSHAVFVSELLQNVPGLNVSTQGSYGGLTQIRIRGAEANHVQVIIDGVEVNDPANPSGFDFAHLLADNIEHIEILRGPQSALWGSDALAGVISITTASASQANELILTNTYGANNSISSNLLLLAIKDNFDMAISGSFFDTDGYNTATTGHERDGYDNSTVNIKVNYSIKDNIETGISTRYTNASSEFDPASTGVPTDGFGKNEIEQIYGRGFFKLNTLNQQWVHFAEASFLDTKNTSIDEIFGLSKSEAGKEKFSYQSTFHLPSVETTFINHSLAITAEREQERFKQQGAAFPGFNPNQRQKITNYSQIAEYKADLFSNWSLSTSLRHDNNDEFDNQTTYRVGVNYRHPATGTKLYLTHGSSAKNPTFTELFGFAPNNFIGNADLQAETSESWELGISQNLFQQQLQLDASLFWEDLIDEIQTIFLPSFQSTVINSESRSKRKGLELSLNGKLSSNLSVTSSYTYLDAREPDTSGNDHTEIRRPKNQWSGNLHYLFSDHKAGIDVNVNYIGDRRDIDFSQGDRLTLNDYTLVNACINYQFNDNFEIFARATNLLNKSYQDVFGFETSKFSGHVGLEIKL